MNFYEKCILVTKKKPNNTQKAVHGQWERSNNLLAMTLECNNHSTNVHPLKLRV